MDVPRLPHGYTNATTAEADAVVKRFVGPLAATRFAVERVALQALGPRLPIPELVSVNADQFELRLRRLGGIPAQQVLEDGLDTGRSEDLMGSLGRFARTLHGLDAPAELEAVLGPRPIAAVLLHGDFGPQNCLIDPTTGRATSLLDWEFARWGHPVEDLAWAEWIVRMHHPGKTSYVGAMYESYGRQWPWNDRLRAMVERCEELRSFVTDAAARTLWSGRLAATRSWTEWG